MEAIFAGLERIGRRTVTVVSEIGYGTSLLFESLWFLVLGWRVGQPVRPRMVLEQMRQIGVDAIPIVCLLAMTVGVMLGIQFIAALAEFGAQSQVVVASTKSIMREFGALITGIVVAGRSGSALAARLGSMVVSQEVDALAVIGVDPVRYLVAPALLAMLVMLPVLTILADAVAIVGAGLYSMGPLDLSLSGYLGQTLELMTPRDVWEGLSKSVVFGLLIALIGTSVGFSVSGGAEGVGRATTRAVVLSISALVLADMLFSFFLNR